MLLLALSIFSALSVSLIGAYFSIIGLATIFPGAVSSVIIMGTALELVKIVTVLWIHRNWKSTNILLKFYFSLAVLLLMFITSIGIFGFLSKSHLEHQNSAETERVFISNIESKISNEKSLISQYQSRLNSLTKNISNSSSEIQLEIARRDQNIESLKAQLNQDIATEQSRISSFRSRIKELDQEVSDTENRNSGLFSNKKKILEELSNKQQEERNFLSKNIIDCNNNIAKFREDYNTNYDKISKSIDALNQSILSNNTASSDNIDGLNSKIENCLSNIESLEIEKTKYGSIVQNLEAEIGPLKYIAALLSDSFNISVSNDQAVRLIILIIMFVFDPLALLLLISIQSSFLKKGGSLNKTYKKLFSKSLSSVEKNQNDQPHNSTSTTRLNTTTTTLTTTPTITPTFNETVTTYESVASTRHIGEDLPESSKSFQKILLPNPISKYKKLPKNSAHNEDGKGNKLPMNNQDSIVLLEHSK